MTEDMNLEMSGGLPEANSAGTSGHTSPSMASSQLWSRLAAEFPRSQISWRAQNIKKDGTSALALAYIDARDVMDRLDSVVGPNGWQDAYEVHEHVTICTIMVKVGDAWVAKADGAGDTDVEAEKGRISDAFKRAAVKWGIGRYLYAIDSPWVDCETYDTGRTDKNGNKILGFRRWKEDPWSKVRNLPSIPSAPKIETHEPLDDGVAKKIFPLINTELMGATTSKQLLNAWQRWLPLTSQFDDQTENGMGTTVAALYDELRRNLEASDGSLKQEGRDIIEASLRAAIKIEGEDGLKDRWIKAGEALRKLGPKEVAYLSGVKDEMKKAIDRASTAYVASFNETEPTHAQKIAGTP